MIACDLGGTWLRCATVSNCWSVSNKVAVCAPKDGGQVAEFIASYCNRFPNELHVGVSVAGIIDDCNGIFVSLTNLGIKNFQFAKVFFEKSGREVFLVHDVSAMALGEMVAGCAKEASNFIFVTLSTGIGGAFIADGKIVRGELGFAGEVGHMTLLPDGPLCGCGKRGCWEALASGSAFLRLGLDMEEVFERAKEGDAAASKLAGETAFWHGIGLANLANAFDPAFIVLGGGQTRSFPIIEDRLMNVLGEHLYPKRELSGFVRLSILGDDAALIGAAYNVLRRQT